MKKKIKRVAAIVGGILLFVLLWVTVIGAVKLMPSSQDEFTEVWIRNGHTGEYIVLSEEEINLLLDEGESIRCKNLILLPRGGWTYRIYFEGENGDRDIVFRGERLCNINGIDYRIDANEGEAIFKLIESFYECRGESEIFGRE